MTEDIRAQKENTVRLFLLEDDDAIGMGLKYSLEKEGYDVIHVKTKRDALESLKENEFDMCILDINLPDGNGIRNPCSQHGPKHKYYKGRQHHRNS